jgi:hypothetical protein
MYKLYKVNTLSIIGFSIVLVLAALLLVYYAKPLVIQAQTQSLLEFEVLTSENSYLQLEPIPITFKLSNRTTNPIGSSGYLGIGANINLISRAENGTEFRWIGDRGLDSPIMDLTTKPNSHIKKTDLISSSLARRLFPNPGRYELEVEFVNRKYVNQQMQIEIIKADPVVIQIKRPEGINLSAYQFLINQNLVDSGEMYSETAPRRQNFVDKFPNSVYWKYVAFDLAYSYFRLKDYEKSEREFYNISDLDFYYTERVEQSLRELNQHFNRVNVRTKRQSVPVPIVPRQVTNIPQGYTPIYNPPVENPPVLIPNPNPNPNAVPTATRTPNN